MLIGFARASRCGPPLKDQRAELLAAGCDEIVEVGPRDAAAAALGQAVGRVGPGDELAVTSLDRLPGSMAEVTRAAGDVAARGGALRVLKPDLKVADGQLLACLQAAAEVERDRRAERQREGIEAARAAGGYSIGRPKAAEPHEVEAALAAGEGASALARRLGIGRATVYRLAAEAKRASRKEHEENTSAA